MSQVSKDMIHYFYGPDSLRRNLKFKDALNEISKKSGTVEEMDVDLDEKEDAWKEIKEFVNQQSIFGGVKVAVVRNPSFSEDERWLDFLRQKISDGNIHIFMSESRAKPLKAFEFLVKKPSDFYEFQELTGSNLSSFVVSESKKRGFSFSPEALSFFVSFLEGQKEGKSWMAVNEIEKFSFLSRETISLEDMAKSSRFPDFDEVWVLTKRILNSDKLGERAYFLEKLFMEEADPSYVFNSLAFGAKGRDLMKLSDYDIMVKSGKLDFPEALFSFVLGGV